MVESSANISHTYIHTIPHLHILNREGTHAHVHTRTYAAHRTNNHRRTKCVSRCANKRLWSLYPNANDCRLFATRNLTVSAMTMLVGFQYDIRAVITNIKHVLWSRYMCSVHTTYLPITIPILWSRCKSCDPFNRPIERTIDRANKETIWT